MKQPFSVYRCYPQVAETSRCLLMMLFMFHTLNLSGVASEQSGSRRKGPHGGQLVELGDREFFLEVRLAGKTPRLTFYLLNSKASSLHPIPATDLRLNLLNQGQPAQHAIPATPLPTDPDGQTSRFVIADRELIELIRAKTSLARIAVRIQGQSYNVLLPLLADGAKP